jgi:hypothetical protein
MKKAFTFSSLLILSVLLFSGCYKRDVIVSEDYWLAKERARLFIVIVTATIMWWRRPAAIRWSVLMAVINLLKEASFMVTSASGEPSDFYNRSSGVVFTAVVTDYWLTYAEAQDAIDYYCRVSNKW